MDTTSREAVQSFYNAVYGAADSVPIGSTASTGSCVPGTNSPAFQSSELCRINWFRAMAGLPAAITFDSTENAEVQAAALMMAANASVQHTGIPPTWPCFSSSGTNAAANANLALGSYGPAAITGYMWEFGAGNDTVGHRRWLLYPQTQVMAAGDVPPQGGYYGANAVWIFDSNFYGTRPATRNPFVAWPPAGYVPYQVVFPQWSFALSNCDFSYATVSMSSNGVNLAVSVQPYVIGFGENTLVWYPAGLDPTNSNTLFPFNGTDTVYSVTVSNVIISGGFQNYSYTVTLIDPSVSGTGSVSTVISGTNQPTANTGNAYTCAAIADPNLTGYQWLVSQTNNGNFFDGAEGTLTNFTVITTPTYLVITNLPGETGNRCFYLTMPSPPNDQILLLNQTFIPVTNTAVAFKSWLGYATTNQIAELQITTNSGISWQNLYTQAGLGGSNDASFIARSLSLSNYAGLPVQLRFNYHFSPGSSGDFYAQIQTNPPVGWFFDNVTVTNAFALGNLVTNSSSSTNFTFTPTLATNYNLQARAIFYGQFPLAWGPLKQLAAVSGPPAIVMGTPVVTGNQVQLNFTVTGGTLNSFHLTQADTLGALWITNAGAVLTTNVLGSSYRFTTTNGPAKRFYRVQAP